MVCLPSLDRPYLKLADQKMLLLKFYFGPKSWKENKLRTDIRVVPQGGQSWKATLCILLQGVILQILIDFA